MGIDETLAFVDGQIAALATMMDPIGLDRVGYSDRARYDRWNALRDQWQRFKTIRGHLLAIDADRKEWFSADDYAATRPTPARDGERDETKGDSRG